MSFAVIEFGSKQFKVQVGDKIYIEKTPGTTGEAITFDKVLMVNSKIGTPYLTSVVVGEIVKQGKQPKIHIIHHVSQKHHTKRQGHRQPYTEVIIRHISEA
ncbi:MAG: 50S ribosomal protein L21 [Mycoplasmataceae bacterium]|jgi:large subunit ribosomal protein L21|nr:50S ribosomal protein L21 [Mycoplasmataceae bacterium]